MDLTDFATTQIQLIEAEKEADIESTLSLHAKYSPIQLQRLGVALCGLMITGQRTGLGGKFCIDFERDIGDLLPTHSFRNGDIVSVRDESNEQSGVVYKITDQVITIAFSEEFKDTGKRQSIFKMANNVTYQRMKDTMMTLMNSKKENNEVVRVLMNDYKPTFGDLQSDLLCFNEDELNQAQKDAVKFALSANQVALIHGPPGTGKTFTCIEVILQLVKRGDRVLVCGPSNLSVDNIVERLAKTRLNIVRIGHPARILPAVLEHSLDILLKTCDQGKIVTDVRREMDNTLNLIKKSKRSSERRALYQEIKHLRGELRIREKSAIQSLLKNAQVVLCTLNGAASKVLAYEEFDTLLVDEASQALEAETWIPILKSKRVIFAGDHMQLPPTVKSTKAVKMSDKKSMKLETTLIDRLVKLYGDSIKRLLNIQYRMNEQIMNFSSSQFYEGKLIAHESVKFRTLIDFPNIEKCEETESPLMFLDTTGADFMESVESSTSGIKLDDSKFNEGEADMIIKYIKRLKNWGIQDGEIAIISPYNAQVDLLKLALREESPLIEIGTVDGFQGREKLVIIISLVRSNDDFEIGFLKESRRLNVALTRAKCHLVVVCNGEFMTLSKDKVLKKMVEFLEEHALIEYAQ